MRTLLAVIALAMLSCTTHGPAYDPDDIRPMLEDQCCNPHGEGCDVPIYGDDC